MRRRIKKRFVNICEIIFFFSSNYHSTQEIAGKNFYTSDVSDVDICSKILTYKSNTKRNTSNNYNKLATPYISETVPTSITLIFNKNKKNLL